MSTVDEYCAWVAAHRGADRIAQRLVDLMAAVETQDGNELAPYRG